MKNSLHGLGEYSSKSLRSDKGKLLYNQYFGSSDSNLFGKRVAIHNFHDARIQSGSGGNWEVSSVETVNAEQLEPASLALSYVHNLNLTDSSVGQLHINSSPNVTLDGVSTRGNLTILGSFLYNDIVIEDSHIGRDLDITTTASRDAIFILDLTVSDDALFKTGGGNDLLSISDLTVRDSLFADLGEGRDTLEIFDSNARRVWLDGGSDLNGKKQPRDRLSMANNVFGRSRGLPTYRNWEAIEKY